jgi:hypothetical protein
VSPVSWPSTGSTAEWATAPCSAPRTR